MNAKEIKKNSYAPQVSSSNRAKNDKKKVKKMAKNDPAKKLMRYDEVTKCWHFACSPEKPDRQIKEAQERKP